ncbi:GbsR/MarR family transcriptional regulator [Candidatus Bipolaricaulota bacterium]
MKPDREAYRQFIEDAGDMIDEHGLPHMAGRVVGALLVCVPPHRSLDELADELQASKGSISMATQLLLRLGVIEKISFPGERRHYYRVRTDVWSILFAQKKEHLERDRRVAENGLRLLEGRSIEEKCRLLEMLVFLDFVAEESPGSAARWEKRRGDLMKKRMEEHS